MPVHKWNSSPLLAAHKMSITKLNSFVIARQHLLNDLNYSITRIESLSIYSNKNAIFSEEKAINKYWKAFQTSLENICYNCIEMAITIRSFSKIKRLKANSIMRKIISMNYCTNVAVQMFFAINYFPMSSIQMFRFIAIMITIFHATFICYISNPIQSTQKIIFIDTLVREMTLHSMLQICQCGDERFSFDQTSIFQYTKSHCIYRIQSIFAKIQAFAK